MFVYGGNDQYRKGYWVKRGSTIELILAVRSAASHRYTPENRGFGGLVLTVSGLSLV